MATISNQSNIKKLTLTDFGITNNATTVKILVQPTNGYLELYNPSTGKYELIQSGATVSVKDISAGLLRYNCQSSNYTTFYDKLAYSLDNSNISNSLAIQTTKIRIETMYDNQIFISGNELGNIVLGNAKDNAMYGLAGDDKMEGAAGNDIMYGGIGNDVLNGGEGYDKMYGESGNDIYYVDNQDDVVVEGLNQGIDTVNSMSSAKLAENVENLNLIGKGDLTGIGNGLNNFIVGNYANNLLSGLNGDDYLNGEAGDDVIEGGLGNDYLEGGIGNDRLYGGEGNDTFSDRVGINLFVGGAGNDSYYLYNTGNQIIESANQGIDTVYSSFSYKLGANIENLVVTADQPIDKTIASPVSVTSAGNELGNVIQGFSKIDIISGNGGNDVLYGNGGNDVLNGGEGDDLLFGGAGTDILFGGAGFDTFVFNTKETQYSVDKIMDFTAKYDKINLEDAVFTKLIGQKTLDASMFTSNYEGVAKDANDYIVFNKKTGELSYDADGNGTAAAVKFAIIDQGNGLVNLTNQDFLVM